MLVTANANYRSSKPLELSSIDAHWEAPRELPRLRKDDVHVWRIDLDSLRWRSISQTLTEDTFNCSVSLDRSRRAATWTALRAILAAYGNVNADEILFEFSDLGKPFLAKRVGMNNIQFNLSHSGDVALIGFCTEGKLGIDLERVDPRFPFSSVVEQFSNKGLFAVGRPTQNLGVRSFFELWTRNEAYAKGTGLGLAGLAARQATASAKQVDRYAWSITSFDVGPEFIGAVATTFKPAAVRFLNCLGFDHVRNLRTTR